MAEWGGADRVSVLENKPFACLHEPAKAKLNEPRYVTCCQSATTTVVVV
jgi:hypothetical protein